MKKILITLLAFNTVSISHAQLLKKLKEKAENAVSGKTAAPIDNIQNQAAVGVEALPGFTYLNAAQAAERFGKKIYVLPPSNVIRKGIASNSEVKKVIYQYWVENNELKYYTAVGKVTGNVGADAGAEILDMGILKWDGTIVPGDAVTNKLPLSNPELPPAINGYGSFEHEKSGKNFLQLTESPTNKYYTATSTTGQNYMPNYMLTIHATGKKYGPYTGTPMMGIYTIASGDVYYASSVSQVLANEAYKNGKLLFSLDEPAAGGMSVKTSVNGNVALFTYMDMNKMGGNKPVWINKLNNGNILSFNDNPSDGWVLMNSGELLSKPERSSQAFEEGKNIYLTNGTNGNAKLSLPNGTPFFSDESVKKWAVWEDGRQLFFSDGVAIAEQKKYNNGLAYYEESVLNPKKVIINNKSYLVWLQVVSSTDVYLCKKEM